MTDILLSVVIGELLVLTMLVLCRPVVRQDNRASVMLDIDMNDGDIFDDGDDEDWKDGYTTRG